MSWEELTTKQQEFLSELESLSAELFSLHKKNNYVVIALEMVSSVTIPVPYKPLSQRRLLTKLRKLLERGSEDPELLQLSFVQRAQPLLRTLRRI